MIMTIRRPRLPRITIHEKPPFLLLPLLAKRPLHFPTTAVVVPPGWKTEVCFSPLWLTAILTQRQHVYPPLLAVTPVRLRRKPRKIKHRQSMISSFFSSSPTLPPVPADIANDGTVALNHDITALDQEDPILSHFGDNVEHGSSTAEPFRLYFQNVRGLKLPEGYHFTTQAMGVLKSVEASVVCLAETNTDWKHPDAHHRVFSHFRMCFNQVKMAVSHSGLKKLQFSNKAVRQRQSSESGAVALQAKAATRRVVTHG